MMKIIEGKRYNTETAEEIGSYENSLGSGDFRNISESLYKTKKGNYFLAGEGGAMTKYSEPVGNMTGGGEDIIPLTPAEALAWAESSDMRDEAVQNAFKSQIVEA